jgi:DNA-binding transcriptional LysR family regulator
MELRNLRAYAEVVRRGGFSAAAKTLYATQPTVSKAIKQLEDELGLPLLERSNQGVRMTQAGEVVYRRALTLLAERDSLLTELDEMRGLRRGELRLGIPPLGNDTVFAPMFAAYRAKYPEIDIRLFEQGSQNLEDSLMAGEIEIAGSLLPVSDAFEAQPVRREPLVVLLPVHHPAARLSKVKLDALKDTPFILFDKGFALNRTIIDGCQRRGFTPTEAARSGQIDFIVALVAAGMGLAMLPQMMAQERPRQDVATVLLDEPDMDWQMALIWRKGAFLSHAAQAWRQLASEMPHLKS